MANPEEVARLNDDTLRTVIKCGDSTPMKTFTKFQQVLPLYELFLIQVDVFESKTAF